MDLEIQGSLPGALTNSVSIDKIRVLSVNAHLQAKCLNGTLDFQTVYVPS